MKKIPLFILLFIVGCTTHRKNIDSKLDSSLKINSTYSTGPNLIVYKTKENYNNLVPVLLSEDKTQIVSYPHPKDLIVGNDMKLPTELNKGYLIDNRGIGRNVAFLKITYDEYSKLEDAPSLEYLFSKIIDKNPLIEFYNCGLTSSFTAEIQQLNKMINEGELKTICK